MKHTQYRKMGQENMVKDVTPSRGTPEDALGSVASDAKELKAAALQLCGNATDPSEAKEFLKMMGYISYPHAEHYYKTSGHLKPTHQRYEVNAMSPTNGWLDQRTSSERR